MIVRWLTITATAFAVLGACQRAAPASNGERAMNASQASQAPSQLCGRLRWWKMPTGDVFPRESAPVEPTKTKARLSQIAAATESYCMEHQGRYPASLDELLAYSKTLPRTAFCRIDETMLRDQWGRVLAYTVQNGIPNLVSPGPDGKLGTMDDVTLPQEGDPQGELVDAAKVCTA